MALLRAPSAPPATLLPRRGNLQQKGGPRHEVALGVAKVQGEGRGHETPGCELGLLQLSPCKTWQTREGGGPGAGQESRGSSRASRPPSGSSSGTGHRPSPLIRLLSHQEQRTDSA